MPPRRSARVAAAAELRMTALEPLPLALAQRILVSLPADSRGRAACVCRGWRALLADPALWTRLDVSLDSGVAGALDANTVVRGAARRARGLLHHLNVYRPGKEIARHVLLAVLRANARSLCWRCSRSTLQGASARAARGQPVHHFWLRKPCPRRALGRCAATPRLGRQRLHHVGAGATHHARRGALDAGAAAQAPSALPRPQLHSPRWRPRARRPARRCA